MFAKDNEEKRSQIWRITVVVATLLIIGIGSYLLHKMFTENPVTGTWLSQTRDLTLVLEEDGTVQLSGEFQMDGLGINYSMDKENKRITFTLIMDEDVSYSDEMESEDDLNPFTSTYTYSVDQEFLTLTDAEFGEEEHFIKE